MYMKKYLENEYIKALNEILESEPVNISDSEVIKWYNEDYKVTKLVSLDTYKEQLKQLIISKRPLSSDLKDKFINKLNEYKLILSETKIELSTLLLKQDEFNLETNEQGEILNLSKIEKLRSEYDSKWIEIKKLETAIKYIKDKCGLSKEENKIIENNTPRGIKETIENLKLLKEELEEPINLNLNNNIKRI